jgi:ubiquinone/menaquinone biosynthesis C-methylase UbiE
MRKRCAGLVIVACLFGGCGPLKRLCYEGFGRDAWQQPERVVTALGIEPGDRVADLGSGGGYFTVRLAPAVGGTGKVYAVDVDAEMNEYLRERLAREKIANVEVILGSPEDPSLPDGGVDLVVTVDTYHHIDERPLYFRNLKRDLAPGGRVAVIDYDGRKGWFVRLTGHYTSREDLLREMREAGYEVAEEHDFIDRQSFVIFEVR